MISLLFLLLAGSCRGLAELVGFKHNESIFSGRVQPSSFWGSKSWERKWRFKLKPNLNVDSFWYRYHRWFNLEYPEKFPLSATALVFLTDGFHLCNWLMRTFITLACLTAQTPTNYVWAFITYAFVWSLGFHSTYNWIFRKS